MKALNDDDVEHVAGGAARYMMCGEWHDGCRYSLDGFCVVNEATKMNTSVNIPEA